MDNKKFLIILISSVSAVFIAAFLSFSFVFGNMAKGYEISHFKNNVVFSDEPIFQQMDKIFEEHQKLINTMNKDFDKFMNAAEVPFAITNAHNLFKTANYTPTIETKESKNAIEITVNLKPFNNDEKNIDFKINDNTVSISADYKAKDKNSYNSSSFYQAFSLHDKINKDKITKEKNGDKLVITIPKATKNN